MARDENVSGEHFDWLVESRSRNQRSTVALYSIIERHSDLLEYDFFLQSLTQDLTAIAFSLWRAVFLSDLTGEIGDQFADVRRFLRSLIAHNTVLYQTDFTSREWAFRYYLQNALFRLDSLRSQAPEILPYEALAWARESAKDEWSAAQQALETAISNFAETIGKHGQT